MTEFGKFLFEGMGPVQDDHVGVLLVFEEKYCGSCSKFGALRLKCALHF